MTYFTCSWRATASNYIITYLRLLTTSQIQSASDDYAGFLFDESGEQMFPKDFCRQYVDPLGKEAGRHPELELRIKANIIR